MDEKKKPGRPPAKKQEPEQFESMALKPAMDRIERLERVIAKMAHYSGASRILDEYGIDRWVPGKDDMRKYKG